MKHRIVVPDGLTMAELKDCIKNGGRFVAYSYCISILFAVTLRRFSKAYLILKDEHAAKYKSRYNVLSFIFGWWAIPWGIIRTIQCAKINNSGGVDVTDDILLNINEESLLKGEVELIVISTVFIVPDASQIRFLKKAIDKKLSPSILIEQLFFACYTNVEKYEEPYFVIGFKTKNDFEEALVELRKAVYSQFLKHVRFEFMNLVENEPLTAKLQEQGKRII
jgi:hypothetical protein